MKTMTMKKIIFLGSGAGFILYLIVMFLRDYCFVRGHCRGLWYFLAPHTDSIESFLFLFPFIFLFSLITHKMREEVFRAWFNFAKWWIPISIFLTLIMPGGSGGGFGIPSIFDKEFLAFVLAALFIIISLIIIITKSLKLRKK